MPLAAADEDALARSLPSWQPFPEAAGALEDARSRGWKLAILSNTDRDYLDASLELIGVPFDASIVASEIGSYKPAHRHWETFAERVSRRGARARRREPLPRHRAGDRARAADRVDQPARRGARAATGRRAALADRARRRTGLARAHERARRFRRRTSRSLPSCSPTTSGITAGRFRSASTRSASGPRPPISRTARGSTRTPTGRSRVGWTGTQGDVGFAIGVVHPRAKGRGIGAELVDRSEAALRTREIARIHQFTIGGDSAAAALLTARGYRDVRHFYEMAIQLDDAPAVPRRFPIEVAPRGGRARIPRCARRVVPGPLGASRRSRSRSGGSAHNAQSEPRPEPLVPDPRRRRDRCGRAQRGEPQRRRLRRRDRRAPAVARQGLREGAPAAHVPRVLRRAACRASRSASTRESPTGATHLYERVGMHVEAENVVFEKSLA